MRRRGFIAALFAPFVARLLPKKVEFVPGSVAARPSILPFKVVTSAAQSPGRIDFINIKDWVRIETKPSDYYNESIRVQVEYLERQDLQHSLMGLYVPNRPWTKDAT